MDWLTFATKMVEALAWPISLIIAILIIRKPLLNAIPFLRKLKYSDVELEFSEEISSLRKGLIQAAAKDPGYMFAPSPIPDRIIQLAAVSPRSAVLEAWKEVEDAVVSIGKRSKAISAKVNNMLPKDMVEELEKSGELDKTLADLYRRQKALTQKYKYGEGIPVDTEVAMELTDLNIKLATSLNRA